MYLKWPFAKLTDLSDILKYHKSVISPQPCYYKKFLPSCHLGLQSDEFNIEKYYYGHTYCLEIDNGLIYKGAYFVLDTAKNSLIAHRDIDTLFAANLWDTVFPSFRTLRLNKIDGVGVALMGTWGETFFHFIFDTIAKPAIVQKYGYGFGDIDYFLVSQNLNSYQLEWFEKIGIKDKIALLSDESNIIFNKLIVPSLPSLSLETISFLRSYFLFPSHNTQKNKKIFIGRGISTNGRRMVNENEIFEILKPFGFEYYTMDGLSLGEQAQIFASASHIAAPHGGALSNIIFCNKGTKILEFFGQNYVNNCFYVIGNQIGLKHFNCIGKDVEDKSCFSDYLISADINLELFLSEDGWKEAKYTLYLSLKIGILK